MKKSGAAIVIEALCRNNADTVFGYPGGAVLPVYDELYKNAHRINHVLCAHEQNAAHAADGFARVSGKPGVVIATSGPGATNLVTGIANAYLDSVPLVAITGNVAVPLLGRDSFQEVDITGITQEIVKHNFSVSDVRELNGILDAAFKIASSGRPGPVLVDIPKSVQTDECDESEYLCQELFFNSLPEVDLTETLRLISAAERPLIYSGGGVVSAGATGELLALAKKISAPVTFSMMGLTALPQDEQLNLGMCGMHGSASSAEMFKQCDLVIALGVRFSDRATGNTAKYKEGKKIIHVDINHPEEKNRFSGTGAGVRSAGQKRQHHCCEMMATYALEGILETALGDDCLGKLFRSRYIIDSVPFVDNDGVTGLSGECLQNRSSNMTERIRIFRSSQNTRRNAHPEKFSVCYSVIFSLKLCLQKPAINDTVKMQEPEEKTERFLRIVMDENGVLRSLMNFCPYLSVHIRTSKVPSREGGSADSIRYVFAFKRSAAVCLMFHKKTGEL